MPLAQVSQEAGQSFTRIIVARARRRSEAGSADADWSQKRRDFGAAVAT
jgi:hypothetical protein